TSRIVELTIFMPRLRKNVMISAGLSPPSARSRIAFRTWTGNRTWGASNVPVPMSAILERHRHEVGITGLGEQRAAERAFERHQVIVSAAQQIALRNAKGSSKQRYMARQWAANFSFPMGYCGFIDADRLRKSVLRQPRFLTRLPDARPDRHRK